MFDGMQIAINTSKKSGFCFALPLPANFAGGVRDALGWQHKSKIIM